MSEAPDTIQWTRDFYEASAALDIERVRSLLREDVVVHVGGEGPIAGDHSGADSVFALFGRLLQETEGTFKVSLQEVIGNRQYSAARHRWTASRGGREIEMDNLIVFRWDDQGRIAERWEFIEDQALHDEFWS
jgi:ketosteroid isomerase-like protein